MTNKNANKNKNKELHTKGSEWKKWDLHIHTPYSGDYGDYKNSDIWDNFIKELEESDLDCIGINDYSIICGYEKVLKEQKENSRLKGKKIFPVIEFRLGKLNDRKDKKVNLHFIINPAKDVASIRKILVKLSKTESKTTVEEFNKNKKEMKEYTVELNDIQEILKEEYFREDLLVAVSFSEYDKLLYNNIARKDLEEVADFIFCASEASKAKDRGEELNKNDKNITIINGSDKHNFKDKDKTGHCNDFSKFSYIKTDCFEGLRILANEKSRIAYSEEGTTNNNINTVIESIKFNDDIIKQDKLEVNTNSYEDGFKLVFNKELVAIIGNKGAGKSLLGWIIYLGFQHEEKEYDQILNYNNRDKYKNIIDVQGNNTLEDIRYFSQNYINNLMAYDLEKNTKLQNFLDEVMDEYKNNENEEFDNSTNYETKIKELNEYITNNDLDSIIKSIENKTNNINFENDNIEKIKRKINQYDNDENQKEYKQKLENVNNLKEEEEKLNKNLKILKNTKKEISDSWDEFKITLNDKLKEFIDILKANDVKEKLEKERNNLIQIFDDKLIKFLDNAILNKNEENNKKTEEIKDNEKLLEDFKKDKDIKSEAEIKDLQDKIKEAKGKISKYEEEKKELEENKKKYEENKKKHKEYFIAYLENKKNQKDKIMLGIVEKFKIHKEAIIKKIESEMQGEDSVDKLIEELKKITIEIVDEKNDKYKEGLEECLKYSDSFIYTIVKIRDKFFDSDGSDNSSFDKIYFEIWRERNEIEMGKVLRSNKNTLDLMNSIFLFDINFKYNLNYDGKDFNNLSGGQKGTALTLVILMFDKKYNDKILIIDQPEDQLDNNTVNTILVPAFKFAKKKRQIFLITHNANLVINADAEQIIVAEDKKEDKKVILKYKAGSLEDEDIKSDICNILEGGKEAFKKRRLKYNIK
jgi:energy-coupling factor transporter ATP-binding protein EcfA2